MHVRSGSGGSAGVPSDRDAMRPGMAGAPGRREAHRMASRIGHPLQAIPDGRRRRFFVPLLVLTLSLMLGVMAPVDVPLRTSASPNGIVSYEVAGDAASARRMIEAWDERARRYAAFSLGVDYLFMAAYSTTIALACVWAAGVLGRRSVALASAGVALAWGQWLAAGCDATENAALTTMLLGAVRDPWPAVAWWSAVTKFALIVAGILYTLAAVGVRLARGRA